MILRLTCPGDILQVMVKLSNMFGSPEQRQDGDHRADKDVSASALWMSNQHSGWLRYSIPFRDQEILDRDGLVGIIRLRSINSYGSSSLTTMTMCNSSMRGCTCSILHHTFANQQSLASTVL